MVKKRIEYIDLAKGFCILLVILYHLKSPLQRTDAYRIILSFFLPLYFFLSGLFFSSYSGFSNFLLRKINKLIVPFLFFSLITFLFYSTRWGVNGNYNLIFQYPGKFVKELWIDNIYLNTPLWFFISLFETSIIFYIIIILCSKLKKNKSIVLAIFSFIIGFSGYELGIYNVNIPFWIDTSMAAVPFFYTGYFFKNNMILLTSEKLDKYIPYLLMILGVCVYLFADEKEMVTNVYHRDFISFYVSAVSGILFVVYFSKLLKKLFLVSFFGQYSGVVLGIHWVVLWTLKKYVAFITNEWLQSLILFVLVVFLCIPIVKLLVRFFPKFVGQKDLIKVD